MKDKDSLTQEKEKEKEKETVGERETVCEIYYTREMYMWRNTRVV